MSYFILYCIDRSPTQDSGAFLPASLRTGIWESDPLTQTPFEEQAHPCRFLNGFQTTLSWVSNQALGALRNLKLGAAFEDFPCSVTSCIQCYAAPVAEYELLLCCCACSCHVASRRVTSRRGMEWYGTVWYGMALYDALRCGTRDHAWHTTMSYTLRATWHNARLMLRYGFDTLLIMWYVCVYICVYICIYIYIYVCNIHRHMYMCVYIHIHIHMYVCIYQIHLLVFWLSLSLLLLHIHICMCVYIYIYTCISLSLYIYIYRYMRISLSLYIYVYIYILYMYYTHCAVWPHHCGRAPKARPFSPRFSKLTSNNMNNNDDMEYYY